MNIPQTPLEKWIGKKIGLPASAKALTRADLTVWQLEKFRETVSHVRQNSPFYRKYLANFPAETIRSLSDITRLPFTSADDVKTDPLRFVCVSQDEIERVVTLKTSGTTAHPKRISFTADDLELTVDFFNNAMSTFVGPGQTVVLFIPGDQPDSAGDLLRRGIERTGAKVVIHGPVFNTADAVNALLDHAADALVGIPVQVLQMVREKGIRQIPEGRIKSVILSADYVPDAVTKAISEAWNCRVFNHYGMTETGYGGGVECLARCGYHFREADLYVEIVDPETGLPKPDGEYGEVVFTTLTRKGMPLVRYRTGDESRFLVEPCSCGTMLKLMEPVRGRIGGRISLGNGDFLTVRDMDEALFPVAGLLNYQAEICRQDGADVLNIALYTADGNNFENIDNIFNKISRIPVIRRAVSGKRLRVGEIGFSHENWFTTGMKKRKIEDRRKLPANKE